MRKKILASVVVAVCLALAAGPAVAQTIGTIKWTFNTGSNVDSSPALGPDGTIYFGCYDGNLYALNPDGSKKYQFPMGTIGRSSFTVTDQPFCDGGPMIIGGGYGGKIYGFDPNGLIPKWTYDLGYPIYGTPVLGGRTIYVAPFTMKWGTYYPGPVFAFFVPDGSFRWQFPTTGQIISSAAVGRDGTIYQGVYSNDTNFYAINPDGTQKWTFPLGNTNHSPALAADGTIYIEGYAINPDGTQKWRNTTVSGEMVVGADGTVYAAGSSGGNYGLVALNPNDGKQKWIFTEGSPSSTAAPAVGADGTIYFGSSYWSASTLTGNVFAVKPDGTRKWVCPTPFGYFPASSSPAIAPDGTIYIGLSQNGPTAAGPKFIAIYGDSPGLANSSWPMFLRNAKHTGSMRPSSTPTGAYLELLLED